MNRIDFENLSEVQTRVIEARVRRRLARSGEGLRKSRCKSPDSLDYGRYMIFDTETGFCQHDTRPSVFCLDLEDVYNWAFEPAAA